MLAGKLVKVMDDRKKPAAPRVTDRDEAELTEVDMRSSRIEEVAAAALKGKDALKPCKLAQEFPCTPSFRLSLS